MVVDIGGGTTEVAVISLGIVYSRSVRVGADKMDEAIATHVKRKYNMLIGESSAEEIKIKIASAYPLDPEQQIEVRAATATGIPQNIIITSEEVRKPFPNRWTALFRLCASPWNRRRNWRRILWTGHCIIWAAAHMLRASTSATREETSLPITVVDDPLSTVVVGTGKALDNLHILKVCID